MFGKEPTFPSIRHAAIVESSFWDSQSCFLCRTAPNGNLSGWQFTIDHRDKTNFPLHSLFEIASRRPFVVPFLALPPGAGIQWSPTEIIVDYDGVRFSSEENDLLKSLYRVC
jgi:hypothetical protein